MGMASRHNPFKRRKFLDLCIFESHPSANRTRDVTQQPRPSQLRTIPAAFVLHSINPKERKGVERPYNLFVMTVDCRNSTLVLPKMTDALSSSKLNLFRRYHSTGRRCSEPMLVGMLWTEQQSLPRRKKQVASSHLRSLVEPRRTIAPATIAMINHADYKPKLILFHQTNEIVLRDGLGRVCAVILGSATSSPTALQQFQIYGVTPIIPKQSKAQLFGHTSSTMSLIKDEVKNRALYEWAVLEATPCRSLFKRRVKLRLDFTADSTFSSKEKVNTIKRYAHCGTKASAMLRDHKHRHSTTMILDHKVLPPSTPLPRKRGGPNEIVIAPGMDPYACVFFLACAEEFIACILP
jgi:hypothetical protein